MSKKLVLVLLAIALAAAPVFAQFRLDVGASAPLGGGFISPDGTYEAGDSIFDGNIYPIPEIGLSFRIPLLGFMRVGAGIRAFSAIVETIAFPNLYAEAKLGPFIIEAQLGGLVFGYFGTSTGIETGVQVLIPDLSAWIGFGKGGVVRIGGGAIGLGGTNLIDTGFPIIYYVGAKFVLNP